MKLKAAIHQHNVAKSLFSPNISLPPFLLKEKVEPKVQADFDAEHFLC